MTFTIHNFEDESFDSQNESFIYLTHGGTFNQRSQAVYVMLKQQNMSDIEKLKSSLKNNDQKLI